MSDRLARALLDLAVRRSPADVQDDNRREWDAELYALSAEGRTTQALRFAASLAVARHRNGPLLTGRGVWHAVRLIVVAPVTVIVLLAASLVAMSLAPPTSTGSATSLMAIFVAVAAVLLAALGRVWAAGGPLLRIVAVVVPGFAVSALISSWVGPPADHVPTHAMFFGLFAVVLVLASRLARAGRGVAAWTTGILGALLAASVATVLLLWLSLLGTPLPETVVWSQAALWFPSAYTGLPLGLSEDGAWWVADLTEFDPYLFVGFAGLALGVVLGRLAHPVAATDALPSGGPRGR
ncbi:hypothetical protein [Cryptosporangium japonicum]|uniref:hypothetical protein n=1 Tax=Cryptosporangium japonicum TaxID=80872 RepID=UPI0031D17E98